MEINADIKLKPEEALKYWRGKVPASQAQLRRMADDAKTKAFVISRLTSLQQVQKVYNGINEALNEGKTINTVVQELKKDKIRLSTAHLRTVVDTNLKMAYGAGRWEQIQRTKANRPYLQYMAVIDGRSSDHKYFDGIILPVDDPFWTVNMPPNRFNCRCSVRTLSQRQVDSLAEKLGHDPVITTQAPFPMNKDFAGIPGQPYKPDLTEVEPAFREQFLNDMARHFSLQETGQSQLKRYFNQADAEDALAMMRTGSYDRRSYNKLVSGVLADKQAIGEIMPAGRLPRQVFNKMREEHGIRLSLVTVDDKQLLHMQRPVKQTSGQALTDGEIFAIPDFLKDKATEWYYDTKEKNVLAMVARNDNEVIKLVINPKSKNGTPYIVTSGAVDKSERDKKDYERLK